MKIIVTLFQLAVVFVSAVSFWFVFKKAGYPGWYVLIPVFNIYIGIKVAKKPGWWLILYFIPIANIVISLIVSINIALNFGRSAFFGIGLFLLPFIFAPLIAFSDNRYKFSDENPAPQSGAETTTQPPAAY